MTGARVRPGAPQAAGNPVPAVGSREARRPGWIPRLVATDLDGTVLDLDQRVHPRTRAAIRRALDGGIHVAALTGRMYRSALPWGEYLGLRAPLVCYQGALIRGMPLPDAPRIDGIPQGRLVAETPLSGDAALTALRVARRGGWHVQAYRDDRLFCEGRGEAADFYARIAQVAYEVVPDLEPIVTAGSTKIVCVLLDDREAAACETALRGALGVGARVVRSLPQFVECTHPQATKGLALQRLCAELGVALGDVVAIGDAPNDTDMLELAGYSVAVRGAVPTVLNAVDAVCAPPHEGGVADVLEVLGAA